MSYQIEFTPAARKQFLKLTKNLQAKLRPHIDGLLQNPQPANAKSLRNHRDSFRLRIDKYRILYKVEGEAILIVRIGKRDKVYKRLASLLALLLGKPRI